MLTGSNLLQTKQFNLRIVHEVIRRHGPLARADIARHTALTGATVSNLTRELIDLGFVHEVERRQEGRGAPASILAVNPDGAFAVGLDFNRDHLTGVLVDLAGRVRRRENLDFAELPTPDEALELMVGMIDRLVAAEGLARAHVCGVGIGIPGPMYQAPDGRGYLVNPRSFPGWHKVPLADWVRERVQLPVIVENNATAAAAGERWYGAGRQIATFFYLFFGTGLGGGIVMHGQTVEGFTGNAGEIGYLPATLAGDAADPESHVGLAFNLPRLYERLRAVGIDARTPADLDALLAAGNPHLLEWLDTGAGLLAGLVLAVEYLLDPEAIIIGGRLSDALLAAFHTRVERLLPQRHIPERAHAPRLVLATSGPDAAALGVATLPIYQLLAPAPQVLLKPTAEARGPLPLAAGFGAPAAV